jgi:predicted XRE-type DNA-binding protein
MSNIGLARQKIERIARKLRAQGQQDLAEELVDVVPLMPVRSKFVTPEIKREVIRLAETTNLHSSEIATRLGINPGRVSEILQGDR